MTQPLGYAERSSAAALPANVRGWPLLAPNMLAVIVLFIPLHGGDAPINAVADYAKYMVRGRGQRPGPMTWDAMITGPAARRSLPIIPG